MDKAVKEKPAKKHTVQYDRWGYFFIAPFFIVYVIFAFIPLITTFTNSFYENYRDGLSVEGPNAYVSKYMNGRKKDYTKRIEKTQKDLQALVPTYKSESTASAACVEAVRAVIAADVTTARDSFQPSLEKVIATSSTQSSEAFIHAVSDLVGDSEPAVVFNFRKIFQSDILKYTWNTLFMWIIGFVPQIIVSLLLSVWFTNTELRLKCQQFFKTVIYMPNLIMASAFAMLFFTLFSPDGPINILLCDTLHFYDTHIRFLSSAGWTRTLVAIMNFLMWYGNTTILLMAGIMGIDESLFEAARIDGASPLQVFFKITVPMLLPIFVYVLITSMIGGIQMFDVPQILTNGFGTPDRTSMTIIMYLNANLANKNYGLGGAISVLTFAVTAILSGIVYKMTMSQYANKKVGGR